MPGFLESVNRRTQLAGHNRLELLLFQLDNNQLFGINVFKVKEVIRTVTISHLPQSHPAIRGLAQVRDENLIIIDLNHAIFKTPTQFTKDSFIIVTEYNGMHQGFLVRGVKKIVNKTWETIHPPPEGLTGSIQSYLTAVTRVNEELVQILDVEQVLQEINPKCFEVKEEIKDIDLDPNKLKGKSILIAEDSQVARKHILTSLEPLGINLICCKNGKEAFDLIRSWACGNVPIEQQLLMLISDIEMPEMDGYTLCSQIKKDPKLKGIYTVLHTSLSGVFNESLVKKVGADRFIPKFEVHGLVDCVLEQVNKLPDIR